MLQLSKSSLKIKKGQIFLFGQRYNCHACIMYVNCMLEAYADITSEEFAGRKQEEVQKLTDQGILLVDHIVASSKLWREALSEAINFDHPVYDLLYIICTRRNGGRLLTIDQKLANLAKTLKIKTD